MIATSRESRVAQCQSPKWAHVFTDPHPNVGSFARGFASMQPNPRHGTVNAWEKT